MNQVDLVGLWIILGTLGASLLVSAVVGLALRHGDKVRAKRGMDNLDAELWAMSDRYWGRW